MSISIQFTDKESDKNKNVPFGGVESHENYRSIADEKSHRLYQQPDSLFRRFFDKIVPYKADNDRFISKTCNILLSTIDQHIGFTHPEYHKARILIKQYYETGRADSLIRLFTLESLFYKYINQNKETSECLASTIYYSLHFLHPRSFKGICYRGLSMTMEEIKDYQWATEKTRRYLVTNTFCSATRDINLAQKFVEVRAFGQHKPVLVEFDFYSNCWTASQLAKLSDRLPSISEIENEREVLILPRNTFHVRKVESDSPIATLYLTFYPLDQEIDDYSTLLADINSQF